MRQNNPADDFLDQLDNAKKEREARDKEHKAAVDRHKQIAQRVFNNSAKNIELFLDALGKRTLGVGKYELRHSFGEFKAKYWVESISWLTGEDIMGDDDQTRHTYQYKKGFVLIVYYYMDNFLEEPRAIDESNLMISEDALKKGIASLYERRPQLVLYESQSEPADSIGFSIIFPLPPLQRYLNDLPATTTVEKLSFRRIEQIMHQKLPESAYKYSTYWDIEKKHESRNGRAWVQVGWEIDTYNIKENWVKFVRV